jgi:hypothetical protein
MILLLSGAMLRRIAFLSGLLFCLTASAAEKVFEFGQFKLNETPEGFRSALTGRGKPGEWTVLLDRVLSALPSLPNKAPEYAAQSVLAQVARERIDEHFPMLIYEGELFDNFLLRTRVKMVGGTDEQMAGIAFRIQDEKNYYYIRASALGDTFSFFRVINGALSSPVSSKVDLETNVWYDLSIDCKGNEIRAALNGTELLLVAVRDAPIAIGKIGFWTKSDSVSYFGKTTITYTPKQILAQKLVQETVKKYPRLQGLKIFALNDKREPCLIAGTNPQEIGWPAQAVEKDVIARSSIYYGKEDESVLVTFPLHDANGDTVAAVKVIMKSFPGQTEKNALARALPIVKEIEARVQKASDLVQ